MQEPFLSRTCSTWENYKMSEILRFLENITYSNIPIKENWICFTTGKRDETLIYGKFSHFILKSFTTLWSFEQSFLLQRTCAYQGGKKYSFFGKFCMLCFLETPVLRFAFLLYYRRCQVTGQYTQSYTEFNPLTTNVPIIQKPVSWFSEQINWLISIWWKHWSLNG